MTLALKDLHSEYVYAMETREVTIRGSHRALNLLVTSLKQRAYTCASFLDVVFNLHLRLWCEEKEKMKTVKKEVKNVFFLKSFNIFSYKFESYLTRCKS